MNIDAVLAFLPGFKQRGFTFGTVESPEGELPICSFSPAESHFLKALYDQSFIIRSGDWSEWQGEAELVFGDPTRLAMTDVQGLRKLLTVHVRKDRFVEGRLLAMSKNGHLVALLERLASIRNSASIQ